MDHLILVFWSIAGSSVPAIWEPNVRSWRWHRDIAVGSIASCAATYGWCEWKDLNGFGERNAIAFFFGVVAVALTRNMLELARSEGFKRWMRTRLGIKDDPTMPKRVEPDSDWKV